MAAQIIKYFSPLSSRIILVFRQQISWFRRRHPQWWRDWRL